MVNNIVESRSYADARIETEAPRPGRERRLSRSYADARIETVDLDIVCPMKRIAFLCGRAD